MLRTHCEQFTDDQWSFDRGDAAGSYKEDVFMIWQTFIICDESVFG